MIYKIAPFSRLFATNARHTNNQNGSETKYVKLVRFQRCMPDKIQHNKQPKTQQDVAHSKSKNRETCMLENRHQNIQPKTPQDVVHFRSTNRATGMLENKHQNIQPKTPLHVVHFRSSYRATCMHTTVQQQSH